MYPFMYIYIYVLTVSHCSIVLQFFTGRLWMMRYLVPYKDDIHAAALTVLFIWYISSKHRHLDDIVSDQGPQFVIVVSNRLTDS